MDDSLLRLIQDYGVPLVVLLVFAVELGVPTGIPIELALLAVGAYAIDSVPGIILALIFVAAADVTGASVLFWISRTGGTRLVSFFLRKKEGEDDSGLMFQRWHAKLGGRDSLAVFVGRTLPLMRKPTTIGTALLGITYRSFVLGAIPAGFLGSGAPVLIGYLIKDDVRRFADEYTRFSHVLVLLSPAIGVCLAAGLWIRGAKDKRMRLIRVRAAAGLIVVAIAAGVVVYTGWQDEWARDRAEAPLPTPLLQLWLIVLGALLIALLWIAIDDVRSTHGQRAAANALQPRRLSAAEASLTMAWVGLVIAVAAVVITIQFRHPIV